MTAVRINHCFFSCSLLRHNTLLRHNIKTEHFAHPFNGLVGEYLGTAKIEVGVHTLESLKGRKVKYSS